jgi:Zn-dependent protease with chaperone function
VRLRVFDQTRPAAYSWPEGTIALSRGLVDRLTADELEAAIAHELGHLISDGWIRAPASLSGNRASNDEERRADLIAVTLLESRGLSRAHLADALRRILESDQGLTAAQREAIAARIVRLK